MSEFLYRNSAQFDISNSPKTFKLEFHRSSFLVASLSDTSDTPDFLVTFYDILTRLSGGCYAETASVELKLY